MASSSPIKNKNGVVYAYQIKVYRGRDALTENNSNRTVRYGKFLMV